MSKHLSFYVEFHVKPECVNEFKERVLYVLDSMSVEKTFVVCYFHQDANNSTRFSVNERWTEPSAEAFMENQLHAKEYRKAYEERLPELLASPRKITFLVSIKEWHRQ
jgi:quinol monooxygenase YgiN